MLEGASVSWAKKSTASEVDTEAVAPQGELLARQFASRSAIEWGCEQGNLQKRALGDT
jgi:hypothetical protein